MERAGSDVTGPFAQFGVSVLVPLAFVAVACPGGPIDSEVTRDQAIAVACQEVSCEPESVEAELSTSDTGDVWRVTFRGRLPGEPPGLFETMIVAVDAGSGKVVSIART